MIARVSRVVAMHLPLDTFGYILKLVRNPSCVPHCETVAVLTKAIEKGQENEVLK